MDGAALDRLREFWGRMQQLHTALANMPFHEGLKPLDIFEDFHELLSLGGRPLLLDLLDRADRYESKMQDAQRYLSPEGSLRSLNYFRQPYIAVVYGPTGCGKSQLLRNLIASQYISPPPETVFFVTPYVDMIPPQELAAWKAQICEGNYTLGDECTLKPVSGSFLPDFVQMSYADLTADHVYDLSNPDNPFVHAAKRGPICIIIDECMEDLGGYKGIAKFFHAFPSKIHDRFPQCTGYSVIVVLHNMNPRKDLAGNISTLKHQAKAHIISPKVHPSQLNRFVNLYAQGLPLPINLLLKDIFNHNRAHCQFDWHVYNTDPVNKQLQWCYLHPTHGAFPMYLNALTDVLSALEKVSKTIKTRKRWNKH